MAIVEIFEEMLRIFWYQECKNGLHSIANPRAMKNFLWSEYYPSELAKHVR